MDINEMEDRISKLEAKCDRLKNEVTHAQARNEERNRQLDALGMCWCSGGGAGGMRRYSEEEVTAEHIAFLMDNALRAHAWWVNRSGKGAGPRMCEMWGAAKMKVVEAMSARADRAEARLAAVLAECEEIEREGEWSTRAHLGPTMHADAARRIAAVARGEGERQKSTSK